MLVFIPSIIHIVDGERSKIGLVLFGPLSFCFRSTILPTPGRNVAGFSPSKRANAEFTQPHARPVAIGIWHASRFSARHVFVNEEHPPVEDTNPDVTDVHQEAPNRGTRNIKGGGLDLR